MRVRKAALLTIVGSVVLASVTSLGLWLLIRMKPLTSQYGVHGYTVHPWLASLVFLVVSGIGVGLITLIATAKDGEQ